MVGGLGNVYVHLTGPCAGAAGDAFVGVYTHLEQRDLVQQRIKRAQRAQPLAEGAVEHHAAHNDCQQNAGFPCEQLAQRGADAGIGQGEGKGAFQHALWAEIFAEEGVAHAQLVDRQQWQQHHHDQQHRIL